MLRRVSTQAGKRFFARNSSSTALAYPAYVVNAPVTDVSTTSNGVRVASETAVGETATVGVWIDAGSRYETAQNNGATHFLEKMAFKGTQKRTESQLKAEIASIGGHVNAYSTREQTVYYAKVFKDDVPKAMEILSDVLQNSKLDEETITQQRAVILKELEAANSDYGSVIFDHLHDTAFQGTGLSQSILGSEGNIRSLMKGDLQAYKNTHYTADKFVVAGAGAVDHKELAELTEKHFGGMKAGAPGAVGAAFDPAMFTGSDKRIRFDSMAEGHIAIAFEGASWTSEYAFPMMVMQELLGSYDSACAMDRSRASSYARDVTRFKLAKSFSTFNTSYKDTGLFGIYLVGTDNTLNDLMWYTMDNMVRLCHNVTDAEVERAKTQLKGSTLMQLNSFSNTAEDIGRQMLTYGRRMSQAETFARIDAITKEDVKATANKFINDEDHALAAIGCIYELPDYNWIRRRSYWHRY